MTDIVSDTEARFAIGPALARSLRIFGAHFLPFTLVAVIAALPSIIETGWMAATMVPGHIPAILPLPARLAELAIEMALSVATQTVILIATFQHLCGEPVRLGEAVARAAGRYPAALAVTFCVGLLAAAGFLALVVPGIIVTLGCAVAVPVSVLERAGPETSIRRSFALTEGSRWRILGLLLVLTVTFFLATGLLGLVGYLLATATKRLWIIHLLGLPISIWGGAFNNLVFAVVYHDLRAAKEGFTTADLAAVFD